MYAELLDEIISLCKPITTNRINSFLNDLITVSKNETADEIDLEGKINQYFHINPDNNNGSIISGYSAGFSEENYDSSDFPATSNSFEILEEIIKDDKYWEFVHRLFFYLNDESEQNIDNFFNDLYEIVENDLTEV